MAVDKDQILAGDYEQLTELITTCHECPGESPGIDYQQRLDIAKNVISLQYRLDWTETVPEIISTSLIKEIGIDDTAFNAQLHFSISLIHPLNNFADLHDKLLDQTVKVKNLLLASSLVYPDIWVKPHPLKTSLNQLFDMLMGWEPDFGKLSEKLEAFFNEAVGKLASNWAGGTEVINETFEVLVSEYELLVEKAQHQSSILKESEAEELKAKRSHDLVVKFVNDLLRGKRLPGYITSFLQESYLLEMQNLLVEYGTDYAFWNNSRSIITAIVTAYQPESLEYNQSNKDAVSGLPAQFEDLLEEHGLEMDEFDDFVAHVNYDFSLLLKGEEIDGMSTVNLIKDDDLPEDVEAHVSQTLVEKVRGYHEGDWFIYNTDSGNYLRIRLLSKLDDFEYFLFDNLAGEKALSISFENFAFLLSSQNVKPLQRTNICRRALINLIDEYMLTYEAFLSEQKSEEEENLKAEEEIQRKRDAAKAKAEAEAIAERKVGEDQSKILSQIADGMKRQARLALNSLALGSWVEIRESSGDEYMRAKLAVKFNATGRHVFVDEEGATVAEYNRDEIIDLMLVRKIKLLESDAHFADRLSKIVTSIRKNE